jgi:hypothetical protein
MTSRPPLLTLPLLLALASPHLAQADTAAAEQLFREGKKLLADGQTAAACEKFAASQKQDPSSGTLLNLADCQRKEGKLATAWATFLSASTLAKSQGNAVRAAEATKRAAELEAKLPYLALRITTRVEGMVIKRNGVVLEAALLDTKIPVDPGPQRIAASAPGYKEWSAQVDVSNPGTQEVTIPALEKQPEAPAPASSASATPAASSAAPARSAPEVSSVTLTPGRSPTVGYVVGGAGLLLLGAGAYFGVSSLSNYGKAEDLCPTHKGCPESARGPSKDASRDGTIATVGIGLGVVGLAAGAYLLLTAGKKQGSDAAWSLSPSVGAGYSGASLGGRF